MERDNGRSARNLFIGIGLGVIAGMLLAPRSGRETRDMLASRSRERLEDLEKRLIDLRDDLADRVDALRDMVASLGEEASTQSRELISKAEVLKADLRSSAVSLAKNAGKTRSDAASDAKRLVRQGASVLAELERATREVVKATGVKRYGHEDDQT